VTVIGFVVALLLIFSEIASFASVDLVSTVNVDLERNREVHIIFDISFLKMPCTGTSIISN